MTANNLAQAYQYTPAAPNWSPPGQIAELDNMGMQTYGTNVNYANMALQQAFDPNSAVYNSNLNKTQNQVGAQEAASGISGSPYGAEVTGSTLSNFNTGWNAQQVQNQSTGAATATGLQSAGATMVNEAGQLNMQNIQAQLQAYGLYGQQLTSALNAIVAMYSAEGQVGLESAQATAQNQQVMARADPYLRFEYGAEGAFT